MQLACGAGVLFAASYAGGDLSGPLSTPSVQALAALCFLVVCGTALAFAAYTWLLRVCSAAAVGTYAFVNPLVALSLAWLVGDEQASVKSLLAAALVVGAVVLTRDSERDTHGEPSR